MSLQSGKDWEKMALFHAVEQREVRDRGENVEGVWHICLCLNPITSTREQRSPLCLSINLLICPSISHMPPFICTESLHHGWLFLPPSLLLFLLSILLNLFLLPLPHVSLLISVKRSLQTSLPPLPSFLTSHHLAILSAPYFLIFILFLFSVPHCLH